MRSLTLILACGLGLRAAVIPAGTELSVRLIDKVASEVKTPQETIRAALIAPVVLNDMVLLGSGAELQGAVKQAVAADGKTRAQLELTFSTISSGGYSAPISVVVSSLENARETVDDKGVITGIDGSQTYSSRIDQGVAQLAKNEKLAALADILRGVKSTLKIEASVADIDYDPGTEFTLKLTKDLDWSGPATGPELGLADFQNPATLAALVNRQPYRTVAERPARPSDVTNLMFIGTEAQLRAAFEKAGWTEPAKLNSETKLETARAMIESRGYKEGPMSILLLSGEAPVIAYQKGNNTFESRHHLRIFRRPDTFDGKPVWVCSSTHDIGIEYSDRDHTVIHRIDSGIDKERAKVTTDLIATGLVNSVALVERPGLPQNLSNATGDALVTDGSMAVLLFQ